MLAVAGIVLALISFSIDRSRERRGVDTGVVHAQRPDPVRSTDVAAPRRRTAEARLDTPAADRQLGQRSEPPPVSGGPRQSLWSRMPSWIARLRSATFVPTS